MLQGLQLLPAEVVSGILRVYEEADETAKEAEVELEAWRVKVKQAAAEMEAMVTARQGERVNEIQTAFRAMDADSNNLIGASELYEVGKLVHGTDEELWTMAKCESVFSKMDTTGDDTVDEAEFTAYVSKLTEGMNDEEFNTRIACYQVMGDKVSTRHERGASRERLAETKATFRALDVKHKGEIDVDDFYALGQALFDDGSWTMEKCQHIFNLIDTDYNEVFDEGEFTRYLLEAGKSMSDKQFDGMLFRYKMMGARVLSAMSAKQVLDDKMASAAQMQDLHVGSQLNADAAEQAVLEAEEVVRRAEAAARARRGGASAMLEIDALLEQRGSAAGSAAIAAANDEYSKQREARILAEAVNAKVERKADEARFAAEDAKHTGPLPDVSAAFAFRDATSPRSSARNCNSESPDPAAGECAPDDMGSSVFWCVCLHLCTINEAAYIDLPWITSLYHCSVLYEWCMSCSGAGKATSIKCHLMTLPD